jgi:Matrixin
MVIAFSIVIVIGLSSLFVLMSLHNTLFSIQGSFSLLQSGYGQEKDVEETDESEDEDEDDENEEANNNGQDEDENNKQTNSIDICCSWDEKLADGELTFKIIAGGESDEDEEDEDREKGNDNTNDATLELEKAVRDAMQEWNTKFLNLKLVEISSSSENDDADIEVQFVEGFAGMVVGATMIRYDDDSFINRATIILPKAAFHVEYDSEVFGVQYSTQKLKEIAVHEMSHALGLGHANFDGDLMSQRLSSEGTVSISECDINGILKANHWKLVNNENTPDSPNESSVNC